MNILANDGISQSGVDALTANGFNVITTNVAQEQLVAYINDNDIVAYWSAVQQQLVKI
jgi:D-3-phosphoglycerate dehydrogenase